MREQTLWQCLTLSEGFVFTLYHPGKMAMWFFMYVCYILSFLAFISLNIAFFQSFLKFSIFSAHHITFIIFTSILYICAETIIIFFFVGTGVSVKEYTHDHKLDNSFHKRSIAIKRKVYPPQMLNLLFFLVVFCLAGAVDTMRFPLWLYSTLFLGSLIHYVRIKIIQNECFRENTQIILDMSGIDKKVT
jgi:hypothetical protein